MRVIVFSLIASLLATASPPLAGAAVGDTPEIVVQPDGVNHYYLADGKKGWVPQWCADLHRDAGATIRTAPYSEFGSLPTENRGCPEVGTLGVETTTTTTAAPTTTTTTTAPVAPTPSGQVGDTREIVVQPDGVNHWYLADGHKGWVGQSCADSHRAIGASFRTAPYSEFDHLPTLNRGCPELGSLGSTSATTTTAVSATTTTTTASQTTTTTTVAPIPNDGDLPVTNVWSTTRGNTFEGYVANVYRGILDRSPDPEGFAFWNNSLHNQSTFDSCRGRMQYTVIEISDSTEAATFRAKSAADQVDGLYRALLGRPSDPSGASHWTGVLIQEGRQEVISGIAASDEFEALAVSVCPAFDHVLVEVEFARLHPADLFILDLYEGILEREPDPAGAAYFRTRLDIQLDESSCAWSLSQSVYDLMGSAEAESFRERSASEQVTALYRAVLGRAPDSGGASFWTGELTQIGATGVAGGMMGSSEFQARTAQVCAAQFPDSISTASLSASLSSTDNRIECHADYLVCSSMTVEECERVASYICTVNWNAPRPPTSPPPVQPKVEEPVQNVNPFGVTPWNEGDGQNQNDTWMLWGRYKVDLLGGDPDPDAERSQVTVDYWPADPRRMGDDGVNTKDGSAPWIEDIDREQRLEDYWAYFRAFGGEADEGIDPNINGKFNVGQFDTPPCLTKATAGPWAGTSFAEKPETILYGWTCAPVVTDQSVFFDLLAEVQSFLQGCAAVGAEFIQSIVDTLKQLAQFAADPKAFIDEKWSVVQSLASAIRADPRAFAYAVLGDLAEVDRMGDPANWAGKIVCEVAVMVLSGGGSALQRLGRFGRSVDEIIDGLGDWSRRRNRCSPVEPTCSVDDLRSMISREIADIESQRGPGETMNDLDLTNIQKGNYGEMKTDQLMTDGFGFERVHTNQVTSLNDPTAQGIDHIYYDDVADEYLVIESKYGTSRLGSTNSGTQMSDHWNEGRILDAVGGDSDLTAEIIENYVPVLARIDENGNVTLSYLDPLEF